MPPRFRPSPTPDTWPHCGDGSSPQGINGCLGIPVSGHTACLAHLTDPDRDAYLAGLSPGADIDHRGTPFTGLLLNALLNALSDPATGHPHLGAAAFDAATFEGFASFESATFEGIAEFGHATFEGGYVSFESATFKYNAEFGYTTFKHNVRFEYATFERDAEFGSTTFESLADFEGATFAGYASFESTTFKGLTDFRHATFEGTTAFEGATFEGYATFGSATFGVVRFGSAAFERHVEFRSVVFMGDAFFDYTTFKRDVEFESATFLCGAHFVYTTFMRNVQFESATFEGDAEFRSATFADTASVGPLVCTGRVRLSGAVFEGPATLSLATHLLECRRTRWSSTAEVRLRYATVDFAHAVFEYPLTIAAEPDPFVLANGQQMAEDPFASAPDPDVRMASLRGVDAAHLVLADIDLSGCLFVGTVHLDQLRLEGACTFDTSPPGVHWRRWPLVRFTERRALAEEHHWRAIQPGAVPGWNVAVLGAGRAGPLQLAPVYRALRKAFEDGKHEPGAADFYYAEMEMRRHADDIPRSERSLLTAYWALSGYGLRVSRALAWLAAAMLLTVVLLMAVGLPRDTPRQTAIGTVPAGGGKVTFEIDKDDPQNPTGSRFTGERLDKSLNITLNSVVFRSSGQDLTTAGTYIEMTSRLTEPVLLGLAVLAIRNRVKR
ncbi:pentapeptide repeat-containing protein [Streptomyces lasiicapitis]|uniref:pentapeptide repeat-containing protein n=1 Tax=Streptomyces lasiicapitis TaxID=1923961 RepID=UPI003320426C